MDSAVARRQCYDGVRAAGIATSAEVRKCLFFLLHLYSKMIVLPRQVRDKQGREVETKGVFLQDPSPCELRAAEALVPWAGAGGMVRAEGGRRPDLRFRAI